MSNCIWIIWIVHAIKYKWILNSNRMCTEFELNTLCGSVLSSPPQLGGGNEHFGGGGLRTDPGIWWGQTKFSIRKLRASLVEGEATNRGREAPVNRGLSLSRGCEAPENRGRIPSRRREAPENIIEGEAQTEDGAREKTGGGVWGGGSVNPSPENILKIKLETIYFDAYLSQTFEINDNMPDSRQCSFAHYIHEKIDIKYLMSGNCLILLKFKTW